MNKKQIESDRLLLRAIQQSDAEAILSYRSLPEIAKYQYWEPYTKEDVSNFIERCSGSDLVTQGEWIGLAIIEKDNGKLVGDCALRIGDNEAEIGCNVSPQHQKSGFAKSVLFLLIDYCFRNTNVDEVFGITDSENTASIKLMESVQMLKSPLFEEQIECKGVLSIEHKYVINRFDWRIK